jgi:hypothetical protein
MTIWDSQRSVRPMDAVDASTFPFRSIVAMPSTSGQERIIARNEMRMHVGQVPTFLISNTRIIEDR